MNIIKQLSVFLENRYGRLTELTTALGQAHINLSAFNIAESSDFGIMRMVVSDPFEARRVLLEKGFAVSLSDVLCLQIDNQPGELSKVLGLFSDQGITVEYMYAFAVGEHANIIICPDKLDICVKVLEDHHKTILDASHVETF